MSDERDANSNEAEALVRSALNSEMPPGVEERMRAQLASFRYRVATRRVPFWRAPMRSRVFRLSAAMACAVALIVAAQPFLTPAMPPTWAEVGARFASVPFFGATVYVKSGTLAEPVQLELWMSQGGHLRMRAGNEVVFGKDGEIVDTVVLPGAPPSAETKSARALIEAIANSLATAETFSLDSFVRALPGQTVMAPPSFNHEASIARDLVVFDMVSTEGPEWIRIWALRESQLPVHVMFWSPLDGFSVDAVLIYSNQQPMTFFDPEAFRQSLLTNSNVTGQAYLLLDDPGGRAVTPGDVERTH